jgi:uncharacterized protein
VVTPKSDFQRFWAACAEPGQGLNPRILLRRLRFTRRAKAARGLLSPLMDAPPGSLTARSVVLRPELLMLFEAPYVNAQWDAATRIGAARQHLDVAEHIPALAFEIDESVELMTLPDIGEGFHLIIDKPKWFAREGVATVNLFHDNTRLFCLSFAIEDREEGRVGVIGGIQGRKLPAILDIYRDFTKRAHGVRPRDFIVEIFRMLARVLGATRIEAVSDLCRHHRSTFFPEPVDRPMPLDYDEIWAERGGVPIDAGWWDIPLIRPERDDIPAKKRALYRARYAMLDQLDAAMGDAVARAKPVKRPEAL